MGRVPSIRLASALASVTVLCASIAPAAAGRLVPPTNSAAGAYLPSLSAPGGAQALGGAPNSGAPSNPGAVAPAIAQQLAGLGPVGLALAHLIATSPATLGLSAPARTSTPGRTASTARPPAGGATWTSGLTAEWSHGPTLASSLGRVLGGGGSHGMGPLLPILLVAITASAFLLAVRRPRSG